MRIRRWVMAALLLGLFASIPTASVEAGPFDWLWTSSSSKKAILAKKRLAQRQRLLTIRRVQYLKYQQAQHNMPY
jgi:hypothetical protein